MTARALDLRLTRRRRPPHTQAVLRAWDDGLRRQSVELLLPQATASEDGGWPGGIRQQFRVAKPMVEGLLVRLKAHRGLEGRITAELLDEGDCVGEPGLGGARKDAWAGGACKAGRPAPPRRAAPNPCLPSQPSHPSRSCVAEREAGRGGVPHCRHAARPAQDRRRAVGGAPDRRGQPSVADARPGHLRCMWKRARGGPGQPWAAAMPCLPAPHLLPSTPHHPPSCSCRLWHWAGAQERGALCGLL